MEFLHYYLIENSGCGMTNINVIMCSEFATSLPLKWFLRRQGPDVQQLSANCNSQSIFVCQ